MKTPTTRLEKRVARWLNSDGDPVGNYNDLMQGGCQSGVVGDLIYYHDTTRFYRTYRDEIASLLAEMVSETGCQPAELFRDWDTDDPLANDTHNQNLLAWFGFEETAQRLMEW